MPRDMRSIMMQGGVNLHDDPRAIDDSEVVLAKNVWPTKSGRPAKRNGTLNDGVYAPETARPNTVAIAAAISSPSTDWAHPYIIVQQDGTRWFEVQGVTYTNQSPKLPTIRGYKQFLMRDPLNESVMVLLGKHDPVLFPKPIIYVASLFTPTPQYTFGFQFAGVNNSVLAPYHATTYKNRVVWVLATTGGTSALIFGDRLVGPQDFGIWGAIGDDALATLSWTFPGLGAQKIIACKEIMQTGIGTPANSSLLILAERNAIIASGEPEQSTFTDALKQGTFEPNLLNFEVGCAAAETVVTTPYGTIWAGPDDVWMMAYGQLPVRVGTKIRPRLEGAAASSRFMWHAEYFDGKYMLAIPSPTQFIDDTNFTSPMEEQWWLDLRNGPPQSHRDARWYGPQVYRFGNKKNVQGQIGTHCMFRDIRKVGRNADQFAQPGDRKLRTIMPVVDQFDATVPARVLLDSPIAYDRALVQASLQEKHDFQNEVLIDIVSKEWDFGAPHQEKLPLRLEMSVNSPEFTRLSVEFRSDTTRLVDVETVDVDIVSTGTEFQSIQVDADPSVRDPGRTLQVRIFESAGYMLLPGGRNGFAQVRTPGGNVALDIPSGGFFPTIKEFLDALLPLLAAANPGTVLTHNQTTALPRPDFTIITRSAGTGIEVLATGLVALPGFKQRYLDGAAKLSNQMGYFPVANGLNLIDNASRTANNSSRTRMASLLEILDIRFEIDWFGRKPKHEIPRGGVVSP